MTEPEKRKRGRPFGSGLGVRKDETLRNMQRIIDIVRGYHKEHGVAPTLKEIAVCLGHDESYASNVQLMVDALVAQGFLTKAGRNQGRSLAVSKTPPRRHFYKPG